MAEMKSLTVQKRDNFGKGFNRRLRVDNLIPCVFYGANGENVAVQVLAKDLKKAFDEVGRTTVFNLEIEDNGNKETKPALFWQVQFHPYKNAFTHVDFYGVDLEKDIKVSVPVEFAGVAKGTKLGGKLEIYREKMTVKGKPLSIPAKIVLDITELDLNKVIYVNDIELPEGVVSTTPGNMAVIGVNARNVVVEEAAS